MKLISSSLLMTILALGCLTITAQEQSSSAFGSLFGALTSPFRQAFNMISPRMDSMGSYVHDGFDRFQAQTFRMFMQVYNKTYSPSEIPKRMRLYFARRKEIEESVRAYAAGKLPYMMRENPYLDWDEEELKALTGVSPPRSLNELSSDERDVILGNEESRGKEIKNDDDDRAIVTNSIDFLDGKDEDKLLDEDQLTVGAPTSIPQQKDWRQSGCVARPVNQHKCGCCYAIATMGVVESMRCIKQVSSPTLSPQQIVDCATPRAGYQNFGCEGGWPTRVLRYLQDKNVAAREACYPLVLRQEACKLDRVRQVSGCTVPPSPSGGQLKYKVLNNERDILYHVASTGPVVTVMRTTDRFLYYGSGIFDDNKCSRRADDVDHAISIVGYGRENGQDYWLIKNSWGTEWGQGGYGKYRRGTNACSIGHWGWVIL